MRESEEKPPIMISLKTKFPLEYSFLFTVCSKTPYISLEVEYSPKPLYQIVGNYSNRS